MNIFSVFLIRRKRRQKSRRRRKMEIRKRQKWRPEVSRVTFRSTVLPAWSTLCRRACAFCNFAKLSFWFTPMFSHCTGVFKESGHASFFMKCYLLVFKMSFFFTCISRATSWDQFISFHMFLYRYVKSTIFIIPVLTRQFIHTGSCSSLQGSCWPLRFT